MSFPFGSRSETSAPDRDPRVVGLDDEAADDLLAVLSSSTARAILKTLESNPTHPSAIAEAVDSSVANVLYHLDRLEDAGAVEVVDTIYSEKGKEMKVYAPAADPLVLYAGGEDERKHLTDLLSRFVGALGLLALFSVFVQWLIRAPDATRQATTPGDGVAYAMAPSGPSEPAVGLAVFLAGLLVLVGWLVVQYGRLRRDGPSVE